MSFWSELKRRNVIRVGVAYLVSAWLLLQVVDVVGPILELPDWTPKLVLVMLAIGFVPVLVFAWAFELTPDGLRRDSAVDRDASKTAVTARKLDVITIGLLIAVALLTVADRYLPRPSVTTDPPAPDAGIAAPAESSGDDDPAAGDAAPARSIAVLPFVNMSDDAANEYFSDGVSEEILNALARVTDLKVAGRTSSFAFKGENQDLRRIGEQLGVSHILEGSVRKAGDRVRITAQLIHAADGFHVWSDTYDRELHDVFAIQDEIAGAILRELKSRLVGNQSHLAPRTSAEVYDRYLLASQRIYQRNRASLEHATELLDQAIAADPEYAPAHAQRAIAAILLSESNYGNTPIETAARRARGSAERALDIDPNNADALAAMGLLRVLEGRPVDAIDWLTRALDANPSFVNASLWLSTAFNRRGELNKGLDLLGRAYERDPLHRAVSANFVMQLCLLGQTERAREVVADMARFDPDSPAVTGSLGKVELFDGHWAQAQFLLERTLEREPGNFIERIWYSASLLGTGQFERLQREGADNWKAIGLNRIGRHEEARLTAERALRLGVPSDFYFQVLAEQGRFREITDTVNARWGDLDTYESQQANREGFGALGLVFIAHAYARLGDEVRFADAIRRAAEANRWQIEQGADSWMLHMSRAAEAAVAGERERALSLLDLALESGMLGRLDLDTEHSVFASLHGDPRYDELVERHRAHRDAERAELGLDPLTD